MIFIGRDLSDPGAHFVTNVVDSIGNGNDLIVDLKHVSEWDRISEIIRSHCSRFSEQFVIYNAYTNESFSLHFKKEFPELTLITFFSDDEWRHSNYDRYLALYSDVFTIAVKENIERYQSYGLRNVHYMQWACNPARFYPLDTVEKDYDVTFIGAAYGQRVEYVRHLLRNGINITVFGPHWHRYKDIRAHWGGFLSSADMLKVISQSRINLNFLWTSWDPERTTIKGRTMELAACRGFQLSNDTEEFGNYGFTADENIAVFSGKGDLVDRIRYYLDRPEDRQRIADAAYRFVLQKHTWSTEFENLFNRIKQQNEIRPVSLPKFRVLVIAEADIQHCVSAQDSRLDITVVSESINIPDFNNYHGVIRLDHDSTINNDALYMMAFALFADKSNTALANFSVGKENQWLHFRDQYVRCNIRVTRLLPAACIMMSGKMWAEGNKPWDGLESALSFIEYPAFAIRLPYIWARILRLFFCDHDDTRMRIKQYVRAWKFLMVGSIIMDKVWQRMIVRVSK